MGAFMVPETWKSIPGYEGYYEASDQGQIRSVDRTVMRSNGAPQFWAGRVLRPGRATTSDHRHVSLRTPLKPPKTMRVHQLVMWAFVGPTPEGLEVCHNNGVADDNRLVNLRFDTHANNMNDLRQSGTHSQRAITHCPQGHEYTPENTGREKKNKRYCRECKSDNWRTWEAKQGPEYREFKLAAMRDRARRRRAALKDAAA